MKLSKKLGLFVATTIAAVGFTCAAYGIEQLDSSTYSVKVAFWNEDEILDGPSRIDYQYATDKAFNNKKEELNVMGSTHIIGPNLSAGKSYWVRWCPAGSGNYSEPYEVVTTPDFTSDAKIAQTSATSNSATITWSAAKGATGYQIYNSDGFLVSTVSTNKATVKLKEQAKFVIYPIRKASTTSFVAKNNVRSALTVYPKNISSVPQKIDYYSHWYTWGTFLNFSWDSVTGAEGYQVEYSLYNGKNKVVKEYENADFSISDPKTLFYRVRVRSFIKCGNKKFYSSWTPYKYVCQDTALVVNLKASSGKKKKIRVAWKNVKGAKKYIVYMAKGTDGGYKKIATTKKRSLVVKKFKKKKLKKGTEYYFKVIAVGTFEKKKVKSENRTYKYVEV